jgi:hypothetical protein
MCAQVTLGRWAFERAQSNSSLAIAMALLNVRLNPHKSLASLDYKE